MDLRSGFYAYFILLVQKRRFDSIKSGAQKAWADNV